MGEDSKADWKDFLALLYAALTTLILPIIIFAVVLLLFAILLR